MAYSKQNFQDGQILNAANLEAMENGIIAGQGVHNLLDNSDFTNPVNSQGKTSWTNWNNYTVDRWIFRNNHVQQASIGVSGMSITTGSSEIYFEQPFDESTKQFYIGKPLTLVFSTNEGLLIKKWTVVDGSYSRDPIGNFQMTIGCLTNFWIDLIVPANKTVNIYWAALYEGSYTAETLPPYVPKGKRVEMLNCGIPPQPRNLLDNSDFRIKNNIINTKGLTDYSLDSGDVFDRWRLHWTGDGRVSIKDGYIELYRETYCTYLFQHPRDLQSMIGKTYTVAAKVRYNGRIGWIDSTQRVDSGPLAFDNWDIATCTFTVGSATSDIGEAGIEISSRSNLSFEVQWVALYEGAYTKETLPVYMYKGIKVEMLNCNVPLTPHNLLDNSDFTNPVNQRGITSQVGGGYGLDRWRADGSGTITVGSTGVSLTDLSFRQPVQLKAGTYTLAFKVSNGTLLYYNFTYDGASTITKIGGASGMTGAYINLYNQSNGVVVCQFVLGPEYTYTLVWAALYEGSYDASTLPAYQPKGYAAELAECQRYFERIGYASAGNYPASCCFATTNSGDFRVLQGYKQTKRINSPTILVNGVAEGGTVSMRNTINNQICTGTLTFWNNIFPDRLNTFALVGGTSETYGVYEAYIDVCADL